MKINNPVKAYYKEKFGIHYINVTFGTKTIKCEYDKKFFKDLEKFKSEYPLTFEETIDATK